MATNTVIMPLALALLLLFCSAVQATSSEMTPSEQSYGLCSQVYQMHQYCSRQLNTESEGEGTEVATGLHSMAPRIGKAGPRGLKGERGDPGIVNYTAIDEKILAKFQEYEARIDAKLEGLERLLNSEIENTRKELQSLKNETKELRLKPSTISDCKQATQEKAKMWDGSGGVLDILREKKLYEVYCDMTTDGGGWTVFQRRINGSTDFFRTWEKYAEGFGSLSGEFWLGLEAIHQLTRDGAYELRIELADFDGSTSFAKYRSFSISNREDNYRLTIGGYSGTAGDSLAYHNNNAFSAKDKDLDTHSGLHCAAEHNYGAWWYRGCSHSSLNGRYNDISASNRGIYWYHWKRKNPYSLKASEMKFRKR